VQYTSHTQNNCTTIQLTPCIQPIYWATEKKEFISHCITHCDIQWETKYQQTKPYKYFKYIYVTQQDGFDKI